MTFPPPTALLRLLIGVVILLVVASAIGWMLSRHVTDDSHRATVENWYGSQIRKPVALGVISV